MNEISINFNVNIYICCVIWTIVVDGLNNVLKKGFVKSIYTDVFD